MKYQQQSRRKICSFTLLALIIINCAFLWRSSFAATQSRIQKLVAGYSVISPDYSPLWVAKEMGFFSANSLDVQVVFLRGATVGVQGLVSGDIQLLVAAGPGLVDSNLAGVETMIIGTLANTFPFTMFSSPQLKSATQLKGKKIAVNSLTGAAIFATKVSLKKFGLNPEKDVTYIVAGSPDSRLALLKGGVVDATVLIAPQTLAAKNAGFNILYDMSDLAIPYQSAGIGSLKSFIQNNRETVLSAMRALIEAIHFIKVDKKGTIKVLAKYLKLSDMDLVEEAYSFSQKRLLSKPVPEPEGIKTVLENSQLPNAKLVSPARFTDSSIVQEINDSGFIDKLYKLSSSKPL
jgi:NitT/TauT family transport system substrate-binding protein